MSAMSAFTIALTAVCWIVSRRVKKHVYSCHAVANWECGGYPQGAAQDASSDVTAAHRVQMVQDNRSRQNTIQQDMRPIQPTKLKQLVPPRYC